jgi:hypothetical protein
MAVHYIESPISIPDFIPDRELDSRIDAPRVPSLGAFRGLIFAIIFEIVLFAVGSVGWELWHMLR